MSNQSNDEIQTYDMAKALAAYRDGDAVYIAHPLDEDPDDRLFREEDIIGGDGHLFIIKEVVFEYE
jgi:hypothetical protein